MLAELVDSDDSVVVELAGGAGLAHEAQAKLGLFLRAAELVQPHDLDGDLPADGWVLGAIDDAHRTPAQFLQDPVRAYFVGQRWAGHGQRGWAPYFILAIMAAITLSERPAFFSSRTSALEGPPRTFGAAAGGGAWAMGAAGCAKGPGRRGDGRGCAGRGSGVRGGSPQFGLVEADIAMDETGDFGPFGIVTSLPFMKRKNGAAGKKTIEVTTIPAVMPAVLEPP